MMKRIGIILACVFVLSAAMQASAQTDVAPVQPAGGAPDQVSPTGKTAASGAEVPIVPEAPAPITAPGAPLLAADPIVPATQASPATPPAPSPVASKGERNFFEADPDAYSIVSAGHGLSLHKPMFLLPATYTEKYPGKDTEVFFQISLKQRLFGIPLYLGYTQKSFWQAFNEKRSSPFRETDYNPELFYRFIPADRERWYHLGADFGFEHESNGQGLPDSRSWNRLYIAPFQAAGNHVIYWKWWYRIPENKDKPVTDPERDDNPDIQGYYGYSELHYEQQLFNKQLANLMFRYNIATGRGAVNIQYTIPNSSKDPSFFWMLYLFQGYGEDLMNYNHSVFRLGAGIALAR